MTTSRKPDPARRPGTGRQPVKGKTGRVPAAKGNNLPVIIGAAGGGAVLLIIVIAMAAGGSKPRPEAAPKAAVKADVPKPYVPDVSALEAVGKQKCEEGQRIVEFRMNPDPGASKEQVRSDLEKGLKLLREGLEAYQQAIDKANKTYALAPFKKIQARGIKVLCTEIEREGHDACDQGLKLIQASESKMVDTGKLTDAEKSQLKADLQKGVDLIRDGMNLFDRSQQVSQHTFETTQYTKARKAAAMKIGELK